MQCTLCNFSIFLIKGGQLNVFDVQETKDDCVRQDNPQDLGQESDEKG